MRSCRILASLIILILAGCSRDIAPLLGQDQAFCDKLYGAPEKVLEVKSGTTRIYISKGMVISVSLTNDTVSGCAYIGASSYANVKKGNLTSLTKECSDKILSAYAELDQWLPFGEQEDGEIMLITKDRQYVAILEPWAVGIGSFANLCAVARQKHPTPTSHSEFKSLINTLTNIITRMSSEDRQLFKNLPEERKDESKAILLKYSSPEELVKISNVFGSMRADMMEGKTNWTTQAEENWNQPTVKTPTESGSEQGTAAEL